MVKNRVMALLAIVLGGFSLAQPVFGQTQNFGLSESMVSALDIARNYTVVPNVTYLTANNWDAKLDLYIPGDASEPTPTLIFFHGGGWRSGSKERSSLSLLPYLEMGWSVVNVEYRLARVSLAPAAVEDSLCALRWIIRNAAEYNLDVDRLVVSGQSAGGHLALTTGIISTEKGQDRQCPGTEELKVAAIVNWYGITDVPDLLEGPNMRAYAVEWFGNHPLREGLAEAVSPLNYVRRGLPPVLTIHGDQDPVVPYRHAVLLHEMLEAAGVPNQLLTISGGNHGGFSKEEYVLAFDTIQRFFSSYDLSFE